VVATRGRQILLIPFDLNAEPKVLLTHTTPVRFAELSPDGEFLVFSGDLTDAPRIFLASRDAQDEFANAKPLAPGYGPSFSHDGRFIYFERGDDGLARLDGRAGTVEPFLPDNRRAHTVRCSRDGKWIAFSMDRAMYLYRTSDKSVRQLSDGKAYDRFPSFAGDDVVFFRETSDGKVQIVAVRTDGSNERLLERGDVMLACCLPEKH
jgi:Tol biopolymer transport system component